MFNLDTKLWDPNRILYKYLNAEGAYLSLRDCMVKCSSPALFNDPFDTITGIRRGFGIKEFSECWRKYLKMLVFSVEEPAFEELTDMSHRILNLRKTRNEFNFDGEIDYDNPLIKEAEKQLIGSFEKEFASDEEFLFSWRINCLTSRYNNLLMWAHYADMHKGAVIGYRCVPELNSCFCAASPVIYRQDIPSLGTAEEWVRHILGVERTKFEDRIMQMFITKSIDGEYEQEYRYNMLMKGDGSEMYDLRDIHPREIHSIYLGCRISTEDKERILHTIRGQLNHVIVYQARKSKTQFKLEFERL